MCYKIIVTRCNLEVSHIGCFRPQNTVERRLSKPLQGRHTHSKSGTAEYLAHIFQYKFKTDPTTPKQVFNTVQWEFT